MTAVTPYHRTLRSSAVVLAAVLMFQSGIVSDTTKLISLQTETYVANTVGVFAAVPENEINMMSAGLEKRKNELDERERNLTQLERNSTMDERTTFLLAGTLFILLILIVLNYVLDFVRNRRQLQPVSTAQ